MTAGKITSVTRGWYHAPHGRLSIWVSPVGLLRIGFVDAGRDDDATVDRWLRRWLGSGIATVDDLARTNALLASAVQQLDEYFAGVRQEFDLPLHLLGTPFQIAAWESVAEIPFGQQRTYSQIAAEIGKPAATRAVGTANGANPLSIVVPCHRLVGTDGRLRGYGGGLPLKQWLLDHEASLTPQPTAPPLATSEAACPPRPTLRSDERPRKSHRA